MNAFIENKNKKWGHHEKFEKNIIADFENQYHLRLQNSTWINEFQQALLCFPELGSFQTWKQGLISEVNNQLELLSNLEPHYSK